MGDAGELWYYPDGTIDKVTKASDLLKILNNGNNSATALNIRISGTFLIDVTLTFANCNIKMSANSQILVKARFQSIQSRFFACQEMWGGIKVREGGSIVLKTITEIEDAIAAVDLTEKSSFNSITKTIFNRNQVGLFLHKENSPTINFSAFHENIFSCTSKLNNGLWASMGINASSVNVPTLGWASLASNKNKAYANTFIGKIGTGISSAYSILDIKLCRFIDIEDANNTGGTDISAYSSTIYFLGLGVPNVPNADYVPVPANATFLNCRGRGIGANSSSLDIKEAYFEFSHGTKVNLSRVSSIIESTNNTRNEFTVIHNNYFNMYIPIGTGIKLSRSQASSTISKNIFTT